MAPPTIPLSLQQANPSLKSLLDGLRTNIAMAINCHAVATVQSFSENDNGLFTITASVNYSKTFFEKQADGTYQSKPVAYPLLVDCPAIILGGGKTALTFPITKGDQCLILFNDRDLNNWFAGARSGPVATARMHSFSDGIALVGFQPVASYDSTHALLSNDNVKLGIQNDGNLVTISNNVTSLLTLLNLQQTVLSTFFTATAAAITVAQIAAAATAAETALAVVDFGEILE